MCGIVYAHNRAGLPVNIDVMQQFDNQRSRGVQGFGLFDGQEGNMVHHSKEDGILKWLDKYPSNMILFHHRFPTSTVNVKRAAHPFSTKDYFGDNQYILVHNGSIRNADKLFCDHQELGINYQSLLDDLTFNDGEALLWDFALTMEGHQPELKAYGAIALVCMKLHKGKVERLYFARNNNPLNLYRDKQNISLSSEGAGDPIDRDKLYNYHYDSNRLTSKAFEVPAFDPQYSYTSGQRTYEYKGGSSSSGAGFQGSAYTPGSTAQQAANSRGTRTEPYGGAYPSIFDCNCSDVGWQDCEYHGFFDTYDDYEAPRSTSRSHDGFDYLNDEIASREGSDDAEEYKQWWNDRIAEDEAERDGAGSWLPPAVKRKFRRFLDAADNQKAASKNRSSKPNEADYEYDPKTQLMLPVGQQTETESGGKRSKAAPAGHIHTALPASVIKDVGDNATPLGEALAQHSAVKRAQDRMIERLRQTPNEDEVLKEMLLYLTASQGHFEQAYWSLELDYERVEAAPQTRDNIRRRILLEKVMERLENDEDYINEKSVSSLWEAVWEQKRNKTTA